MKRDVVLEGVYCKYYSDHSMYLYDIEEHLKKRKIDIITFLQYIVVFYKGTTTTDKIIFGLRNSDELASARLLGIL